METVQRRDGRALEVQVFFGDKVMLKYVQVDAIVSSVNRMGVFADVGPLPVFVSNHVRPPTNSVSV